MKRGQKPSRHYRRIHTHDGWKKILINRAVIKRGRIKPKERRIFNHLSNPKKHKVEYGGAIDFDKKGKVERFEVFPGSQSSVYLPDYEVLYHTHPDRLDSPPSPEDVFSLIKSKNQQAEIVFRDGHAFIVTKTKESRKLEKLSDPVIKRMLEKSFGQPKQRKKRVGWEKRVEQAYRKLGFKTKRVQKNKKGFDINIKPKEPKPFRPGLGSMLTSLPSEGGELRALYDEHTNRMSKTQDQEGRRELTKRYKQARERIMKTQTKLTEGSIWDW